MFVLDPGAELLGTPDYNARQTDSNQPLNGVA